MDLIPNRSKATQTRAWQAKQSHWHTVLRKELHMRRSITMVVLATSLDTQWLPAMKMEEKTMIFIISQQIMVLAFLFQKDSLSVRTRMTMIHFSISAIFHIMYFVIMHCYHFFVHCNNLCESTVHTATHNHNLHNIAWWVKISLGLLRCNVLTCMSNCSHWKVISMAPKVWLDLWKGLFNWIVIQWVRQEKNELAN